jgi:MFS family permease|tara:strand:- start:166033 stop:167610 length:1578 start_codon:yes stop_codon:yes gene_type:complete
VSNLGYVIQSVGAAWLMTEIARSPAMVALVQTSTSLPIMLLALLSGAIADSFDRRRVMLVAQGLMLFVSLALVFLSASDLITPYLLLGFTFLIGCGMALNSPAWQATVGDIVPKPVLPAAVAYNSIAFNVARSGGPAIGGAIVAAAGSAAAFAVNCFSYLPLIAVLLRWKVPPTDEELPPERIGNAVTSGLRYFVMSPHHLVVIARSAIFAISASAVTALMPVIARDIIGGGALIYGLLLGAFGAGAVGGAFASARLRRSLSIERIVAIASLLIAIGAAGTALSGSLFTAMPALALAGCGWILGMSTLNVTIQLASPRWVVARAISVQQTAIFGGMALGSWLFGIAADNLGIPLALAICAALHLGSIIVGRFLPLPEFEDLNLDPLRRWTTPDTAVPVEARNGPVAVSILYRVAPADVPEFLNEMRQWRRVRRRDGARRWALYRDLADPELWIERYHVSTWLEYVRHNQRRTHADSGFRERIFALHKGPGQPEVHRMLEVHPAHYVEVQPGSDGFVARDYNEHAS